MDEAKHKEESLKIPAKTTEAPLANQRALSSHHYYRRRVLRDDIGRHRGIYAFLLRCCCRGNNGVDKSGNPRVGIHLHHHFHHHHHHYHFGGDYDTTRGSCDVNGGLATPGSEAGDKLLKVGVEIDLHDNEPAKSVVPILQITDGSEQEIDFSEVKKKIKLATS